MMKENMKRESRKILPEEYVCIPIELLSQIEFSDFG